MSELFVLPEKIREVPSKVPMYKALLFEDDPEKRFDERLKNCVEIFGLKSQPKDHGDSVVFQEETFELEIFRASDSIWWTHNELAYREKVPPDSELPSEGKAVELAAKYLEQFKIDTRDAKYSHVSHSKVIAIDKKNEKEKEYNTRINVNYSFSLGGVPIEGPGAKLQVAFVEQDELCELYYFWREPKEETKMPVIPPNRALAMFCEDDSFKELTPDNASVQLHSIDFVYYALPALEVQPYYLPAYKIDGTAQTEFHKYDFTNFFIALDLTMEEMKGNGILTDASLYRIIE